MPKEIKTTNSIRKVVPQVSRAVSSNKGESWPSLKAAAEALGYKGGTTIRWHIKQGTPAVGGRILRYA